MIGEWLDVGPVDQIAPGNARTLPVRGSREIAIFRTLSNEFHALVNACPHKAGPLSQGIIHGSVVTCPLHSWNISLRTGQALGEDVGCTPVIPLKVNAGRIYLLRAAVVSAPVQAAPAVSEAGGSKPAASEVGLGKAVAEQAADASVADQAGALAPL